jgi:hypothetical protein
VDRGVIATAAELFDARHFPGVIAMCNDALDDEPECVPLLLIRARAHVALRRDLDAQADLRDIIRLDPRCGPAYRLLGELAARGDDNAPAAQFFREALRLDPDDREARDWLMIVDASVRPAAGAAILPAPALAAGRCSPPRTRAPAGTPRLARGTESPDRLEERPTRPFARALPEATAAPRAQGTGRQTASARTPVARPAARPDARPEARPAARPVARPDARPDARPLALARAASPSPAASRPPARSLPAAVLAASAPGRGVGGNAGDRDGEPLTTPTVRGMPPMQRPARMAPRLITQTGRRVLPDLPGFGEYLVAQGILSRERLRVAQAYQRSMNVHLATAIITLGLANPQRVEWAAVAHHAQTAGESDAL